MFSAFCFSLIASLNLTFCSKEARLALTVIRDCFEECEPPEEVEVLEQLLLRDAFDQTDVVSSLSRDASLLNVALLAPWRESLTVMSKSVIKSAFGVLLSKLSQAFNSSSIFSASVTNSFILLPIIIRSFEHTNNAWYAVTFAWKNFFATLVIFSFTAEWNSNPFSVIVRERVSDSLVSLENSVVSAVLSVAFA